MGQSRGSSAQRPGWRDRSGLRVEVKRSSSSKRQDEWNNEPKTVYMRETGDLQGKGRFCVNIGVQCDLKLAHPHYRAMQTQLNRLKVELDKAMEELTTTSQKLEEKEKALSGAELEVSALNRRVQVDFDK